ncbi:MAG: MBL fold metallo-hydrolase, partial [Candidatus Hodarchaeota archaeon]
MKNIKMIGMSVVLVCSIILVNWNFIPAQADANLVFYLPTDEGSGLLPATSTQTSTFGEVDYAKITVLMDNNGNGSLKSGHGLSILVETHNLTILLDSGLSDLLLKQNVEDLGKNLSLVDFAVISHEHFDHIDGMPYFAEVNPNATVYVPAGMASAAKTTLINLNLSVVDIAASTILSPGVAIIGQLNGPPMEQALTINISKIGQVILVGCSHPGVENIVSKAINDF